MPQRARKGLATWLTSCSTPIFVLDSRNVVLVFNQGCEVWTGWSAADVIGQTCIARVEPDPTKIESLTGILAPPASAGRRENHVVQAILRNRDGGIQTVDLHFFPLAPQDSPEEARMLGVITPSSASGIEIISEGLGHRFELAKVLAELHQTYEIGSIVAKSEAMRRVVIQARLASHHPVTVQLIGERGVGKEHVARLIHYQSATRERRFISIDCKNSSHFEISRVLRRVFAEEPRETLSGSVYLQHISHLPQDLQYELLTHLRARSRYRWMTANESTTQSTLPELSALLTPLTIMIPPLRERRDELLLMVQMFLDRANRAGQSAVQNVSPGVEEQILLYDWPGNVAELEAVIEGAVKSCQSATLDVHDLPLGFRVGQDAQRVRPVREVESLDEFLARIEKARLVEVLKQVRGNKSAAAEILKLPRAKLYRRLEMHGLLESRGEAD